MQTFLVQQNWFFPSEKLRKNSNFLQIACTSKLQNQRIEIRTLNSIMQGFKASDLKQLQFTDLDPINKLGSLTKWETDQVVFILIIVYKIFHIYVK